MYEFQIHCLAKLSGPRNMRGEPVFAACIKCAGGPTRIVRALCGSSLNESGRPALPPLVLGEPG